MNYVLSPSTLNLFSECQKCFYETVKEKRPRPSGPFPSLPSGMDNVLKRHFDFFMNAGSLPPSLKSLEGEVKLFDDEVRLKKWRGREGVSWVNQNGDVLKGSVDNLLVSQEGLIVLDYKTRGFPLKEDTASHYIPQMNAYNYLLRKNGFRTADYSYLLFYIPESVNDAGLVVFDTQLVRLPVNTPSVEKTFLDALAVLRGKKPEGSKGCGFCSWADGRK